MTERVVSQTRALLFDLGERAAESETIPVVISSDAVVEIGRASCRERVSECV